jgi:hypothetical protein
MRFAQPLEGGTSEPLTGPKASKYERLRNPDRRAETLEAASTFVGQLDRRSQR